NRDKVRDHSWLSKTLSRLPHEVHEKVFGWVLALVAERGLVKGERIGVDGSTMEANAALRTIVRRERAEPIERCRRGWPKRVGSRRRRSTIWSDWIASGRARSFRTRIGRARPIPMRRFPGSRTARAIWPSSRSMRLIWTPAWWWQRRSIRRRLATRRRSAPHWKRRRRTSPPWVLRRRVKIPATSWLTKDITRAMVS